MRFIFIVGILFLVSACATQEIKLPKGYVSTDPEQCAVIRFFCDKGNAPFFDETGCGCGPIGSTDSNQDNSPENSVDKRIEVESDPDMCKTILFQCADGRVPYFDNSGCGCELRDDSFCTPSERMAEVCTLEYNPVCGWFSEEIQCIKYPCAQTFGNRCGACAAKNVAYVTPGECSRN